MTTRSTIGAAVDRSPPAVRRPTVQSAHQLLQLQRLAGNRATAAAVQRLDPDFAVAGVPTSAAATTTSVFFDKDSATLSPAEEAKLAAFAVIPPAFIRLKGYSSEEETGRPVLVDNRIATVANKLTAQSPLLALMGGPTRSPDLAAGIGRLDYRQVRRVEILVAGAASSQPNCAAGADVDPGPAPNAFTTAYDVATTTLLPNATSALASPRSSPAKEALALFGGPSKAGRVKTGLDKIAAHFPNMRPHIPLNDPAPGGHRVINACEGDVLAYNSGEGPGARMTVGPRWLADPDPVSRAMVLIHEASHGASGLLTEDRAYSWQRLLAFLTPAEALRNADSFTQLVRLIHDPGAPGASRTDVAAALPAARRAAALEAIAWLEQWLVQARLELRTLYSAANNATKHRAWQPDDEWYRDNVMGHVAARFGLTAPPAVPSADDQASIAGIYDRLFQLRVAITSQNLTLEPGSPSAWAAGPGDRVTLSPSLLRAAKLSKIRQLLPLIVEAATFIESGRKPAYVGLVRDMSSGFGSP